MPTQGQFQFDAPAKGASKAGQTPGLPGDAELRRILDYLQTHCMGPDRARTAAQIAADLGYTGNHAHRKVRRVLNLRYRELPVPVVGLREGFFVATAPDQLTHKARELHARLKALAVLLADFYAVAARSGYQRAGGGPRVEFSRPGAALYYSRVS